MQLVDYEELAENQLPYKLAYLKGLEKINIAKFKANSLTDVTHEMLESLVVAQEDIVNSFLNGTRLDDKIKENELKGIDALNYICWPHYVISMENKDKNKLQKYVKPLD